MIHASESGHWYDRAGNPVYTVLGRNGEPRPVTLRDARRLNLVPGVSGVMSCAAKPGLVRWQINQAVLAAMTLPRNPDEEDEAYIARILRDSQEQARKAAERGTAIHAAIQGHYEGMAPDTEYWPHVVGARDALNNHFRGAYWIPERSFAAPIGYGGKCDLCSLNNPYVCDFKTKEFDHDTELKTWDEHAMQLAAYREGLDLSEARCAIVYVSTTVPGLARVMEIEERELLRGWDMFKALLSYWKVKSNYASDFEEAVTA